MEYLITSYTMSITMYIFWYLFDYKKDKEHTVYDNYISITTVVLFGWILPVACLIFGLIIAIDKITSSPPTQQ